MGSGIRIVTKRSRISVVFPGNHFDFKTFCPNLQLFNGCGTEGIGGSQHHGVSILLEKMCQFRCGGRFPGTIDADHQDHLRPVGQRPEFRIGDWEDLFNVGSSDVDNVSGRNLCLALLKVFNDSERHRHANIGANQGFLELIPVDRLAAEPFYQVFEKFECHAFNSSGPKLFGVDD